MTPQALRATVGILLGILLVALDQTIVATALPRIADALEATQGYAWVVTAYFLGAAVALPIVGRLSDLVPCRRVLLGANLLFTVGTLLCGLAPGMGVLVFSRLVEGLGGGALLAASTTAIGLLFPPRDRGLVMGYRNALFGVSSVAGPLVGGLLADHFSWRWVFLVNLPLAVVGQYYLHRHMPDLEPAGKGRLDGTGSVLLLAWSVPLLLGLSWGGTVEPWTSPLVLSLLAGALLGLAAFVVRSLRTPDPLFDLRLLRHPTFAWAAVGAGCVGSCFLAVLTFLPLYLVQVKGISATVSGLVLAPMGLAIPLGSAWAGARMKSTGRCRGLLAGSCAAMAAVLLGLGYELGPETPAWVLLAAQPLLGLAFGVALPLYSVVVQNAVPAEQMGEAGSGNLFFRQLGQTLGVALLGTLMASTLHADLPPRLPRELESLGVQVTVNRFQEPRHVLLLTDEILSDLEHDLDRGLRGDREAWSRVQDSPALPEGLRGRPVPPDPPPEERQRLEAQVQDSLVRHAGQVARAVERAYDATLSLAVGRVFVWAGILGVLALASAAMTPDTELQGAGPGAGMGGG